LLVYFVGFTNTTTFQSFNHLVANNKQVAAAASVSTNSNLGIADAMQTNVFDAML
jgi:hypothetical protein